MDANQSMSGENAYDRMSGDEELGEEKHLAQTSSGQKRSRHEFEVESDEEHEENHPTQPNGNGKETVEEDFNEFFVVILNVFFRIKSAKRTMTSMKKNSHDYAVVFARCKKL